MSINEQNNADEQQIDLAAISKSISGFFRAINQSLFLMIQFIFKHIIVIGILALIGVGAGLYLDKTQKLYSNEIIIHPNYGSTDYTYSKIDFLQSKIKDQDTVFLKSIGIQNPSALAKIEITPVIDIYKFISNTSNKENEQNFQILKLMSEDGDIKKIVTENATSKNYPYHKITYITKGLTSRKGTVEPILNYLELNEYFSKLKETYLINIENKLLHNKEIIAQIDGVLTNFSKEASGNPRKDNLVYYNENTQLNDVIQSKRELVNEINSLTYEKQTADKVAKESCSTINILDTKALTNKLEYILPALLILFYVFGYFFIRYYKKQASIYAQRQL